MSEDHSPTPVEIAERPWVDPLDALQSGAYRARPVEPKPDEADHLVVYLRSPTGDPKTEYRGQAAICGRLVSLEPKLSQMGPTCEFCLNGAGRAFEEARGAIAAAGGFLG